jgi:anti-sigma B factor antagonist
MKIVEKPVGAVTVVCLVGRLDKPAADVVGPQITQMLQEGKKYLLFDFAEVSFMASGGIRVLLQLHKQALDRDGRIILARLPLPVRDILDLVGYLRDFEVCATVEEGLEAFTRPAP